MNFGVDTNQRGLSVQRAGALSDLRSARFLLELVDPVKPAVPDDLLSMDDDERYYYTNYYQPIPLPDSYTVDDVIADAYRIADTTTSTTDVVIAARQAASFIARADATDTIRIFTTSPLFPALSAAAARLAPADPRAATGLTTIASAVARAGAVATSSSSLADPEVLYSVLAFFATDVQTLHFGYTVCDAAIALGHLLPLAKTVYVPAALDFGYCEWLCTAAQRLTGPGRRHQLLDVLWALGALARYGSVARTPALAPALSAALATVVEIALAFPHPAAGTPEMNVVRYVWWQLSYTVQQSAELALQLWSDQRARVAATQIIQGGAPITTLPVIKALAAAAAHGDAALVECLVSDGMVSAAACLAASPAAGAGATEARSAQRQVQATVASLFRNVTSVAAGAVAFGGMPEGMQALYSMVQSSCHTTQQQVLYTYTNLVYHFDNVSRVEMVRNHSLLSGVITFISNATDNLGMEGEAFNDLNDAYFFAFQTVRVLFDACQAVAPAAEYDAWVRQFQALHGERALRLVFDFGRNTQIREAANDLLTYLGFPPQLELRAEDCADSLLCGESSTDIQEEEY